MRWLLILLIVSAGILAGCGSVSEEQAKATALEFVNSRVRVYTQDPANVLPTQRYIIVVSDSSFAEGKWIFLINVSSTEQNQSKNALIRIEVDSKSNQVVGVEQFRQEESFK